jgi:hypothetical protein
LWVQQWRVARRKLGACAPNRKRLLPPKKKTS